MRIIRFSVPLIIALLTFFPGRAQALPLRGGQLEIGVNADLPVWGHYGATGSYGLMLDPSSDLGISVWSLGVKLDTGGFWLAPQLGVASSDDESSALYSLSGGLSWHAKTVQVSFREDAMPAISRSRGRLDAEYHYDIADSLRWLNIGGGKAGEPLAAVVAGAHAEHINSLVTFGPHLGVYVGFLRMDLRHNLGMQEANKGHAIRFVALMDLSKLWHAVRG